MQIFFLRHGNSTQQEAYKNDTTYDKNNIKLTKLGEKQAKETAEYIKMYGNFDAIYSSPLLRATQTANIIKKIIKYKKEIEISELLEENNLGILEGMRPSEADEYMRKNKTLQKLYGEEDREQNLFKKIKITEQLENEFFKYAKSTLTYDDQMKNVSKFLDFLKKQNHKRVLVVCHGGILDIVSSIITNTSIYNIDLAIVLRTQTTRVVYMKPFLYGGNCDLMGVLLEDDKYKLVIPRNNLHLKK
jgi:broad specificity phosphatase PhoE